MGVIVFALAAGIAAANPTYTIDQQNTVADSFLGPSGSPGQSFTPTLTGIDTATFELATSDPTNGALVFAVLYQGDGFGGSTLASSSNELSILNTSAFAEYTFNFSPAIALTLGQVYTLRLFDTTGSTLYEEEGSGNPYAGGVEYDSNGVAQTGFDLVFSEGAQTPEPTTFWTLLAGLAAVGAFVMKREPSTRK
jgi:hypothetical protein